MLPFFLICSNIVFSQLSISIESANTNCGYRNGYVFATVTGGTQPYYFSDNGGGFQISGLFTSLNAGSHIIKVRDVNGATASSTVILTNMFLPATLSIQSQTQPSLCNVADGILVLGASGSISPYTYSVDGFNYQSSPTFNNLSPGNYNLSLRDGNNCATGFSFSFKSYCNIAVSLDYSKQVCASEGYVTATPTSTLELPYTYSLDGTNYQTSNMFTNLASGLHRLYIKSSAGTISINAFGIQQHCDLPLTYTTTESRCGMTSGSITINVSGGREPIFYSILGGNYQQSNTIQNLATGSYTIQVKDASGSTGILMGVVVGQFCPVLTANSTPSACTSSTGTISVINSTGTAPIVYSINGTTFQSGKTFIGLSPNVYTLTSKDAKDIVTTASVTVSTANGPSVAAIATPAGCTVNNGTITTTGSGGTSPFTYQIIGGSPQPSGVFTGLKANIYTVKVIDKNGCSNQEIITVPLSSQPTLNALATEAGCSVKTGTITALAAGGIPPYRYNLDNGPNQTTDVFQNIGSGSYKVQVQDANGCNAFHYVTVATTDGPSLNANFSPESCAGNDASIDLSGSGGLAPYLYSLNNGMPQASGYFSALTAGTYNISVTDANNCSAQQQIDVTLNNTVTVDAGSDASICFGDSTSLNGSSGSQNVSFMWFPADGLSSVSILSPKVSPAVSTLYFLTATNGVCSVKDSTLVTINPLPIASAGEDTTICYDQNITLHGSGGSIYRWSPASSFDNPNISNPELINPTMTATYALSVTDDNGCNSLAPDEITIFVGLRPVVFAGNDTAVLLNKPFMLQAVDVNNIGFTNYLWTPNLGLDNPNISNPTLTPTIFQTYEVEASTAFGCKAFDTIAIKVYKESTILVPNGFTPNNDGINDVLHVIPIGIRTFKYFAVFNRFGQQVFVTNDPGKGWDGLINGQKQNTGGYVWVAEGITFDGSTIKRSGTTILIH